MYLLLLNNQFLPLLLYTPLLPHQLRLLFLYLHYFIVSLFHLSLHILEFLQHSSVGILHLL